MGLIKNDSNDPKEILACQRAVRIFAHSELEVPALLANELRKVKALEALSLHGKFDLVKGNGITFDVIGSETFLAVTKEVIEEPVEEEPVEELNPLELIKQQDNPVEYMVEAYNHSELLELVSSFIEVNYKIKKENKESLAKRILEYLTT